MRGFSHHFSGCRITQPIPAGCTAGCRLSMFRGKITGQQSDLGRGLSLVLFTPALSPDDRVTVRRKAR